MNSHHKDRKPNTTILFAELADWEQTQIQKECCGNCNLIYSHKKFEDIDQSEIPQDAEILSVFVHSNLSAEYLKRMPKLKLIAIRATGFDKIDLDYCKANDIYVANVPRYGDDTVAEHAFAMLLALTRKIHRCYERTTRGDFSLEGLRGMDLAGKVFGCLGVGKIGTKAIRIAGGFGMNRIAHQIHEHPLLSGNYGFHYVDFDTLLRESDILSIHVPYNKQTHHMIDRAALQKMKVGAIIINTARGGIIDSTALLEALKSGHLGGACLDVLEAEELIAEEAEILSSDYDVETLQKIVQSHKLLKMPNVIITPHNAFNSFEACRRIVTTTVDNIHAWMKGDPINIVNK